MKITRFGHAAIVVDVADQRVLIDPGSFAHADVFEVTDVDAIIVTHEHADHLDRTRVDGLLAVNPGAILLAPHHLADELGGSWTGWTDGVTHHLGEVTLTGVGTRHAEILPVLPRIANTGVTISASGSPTLFHPGDSYESVPPDVDVLALPLSAPWAKASETLAFVQAVSPASLFPIHDRTISDLAYDSYWNHATRHGGVPDARRLGQAESTICHI